MAAGRRHFADSAPVSRSVRLDVDIVLPDEAARIEIDRLVVPRTTPEQSKAAAVTLCAIAGRGFDIADPVQLAAAVRYARPALEALGVATAAEEPPPPPEAPRYPCGTPAGYSRHRRLNERACQPCLDANADYHRSYPQRPQRQARPCGTETAYKRHRDRGEEACEPCKEAHNAYVREKNAQRAAARANE